MSAKLVCTVQVQVQVPRCALLLPPSENYAELSMPSTVSAAQCSHAHFLAVPSPASRTECPHSHSPTWILTLILVYLDSQACTKICARILTSVPGLFTWNLSLVTRIVTRYSPSLFGMCVHILTPVPGLMPVLKLCPRHSHQVPRLRT